MSFASLSAAISVQPPRARSWTKRLRRWFPIRESLFRVRDAATTVYGAVEHTAPSLHWPTLPIFLRMVVPGWAHRALGYRARGWLYQALYFPLLLFGLAALGSGPGMVALGLAFSVHAASIIDIVIRIDDRIVARIIATAGIMAVLYGAVYYPAVLGVTRFASTRQLRNAIGPFAPGDVFMFNPSAYRSQSPEVGDVLLYRQGQQDGYGYVVREGEMIGRVLARAGNHVEWKNGELFVDGAPCQQDPMVGPFSPTLNLGFKVPEDQFIIYPAIAARVPAAIEANLVRTLMTVSRAQILGRVYLRHYPWRRWWWVE
jgi:hypothetical protein